MAHRPCAQPTARKSVFGTSQNFSKGTRKTAGGALRAELRDGSPVRAFLQLGGEVIDELFFAGDLFWPGHVDELPRQQTMASVNQVEHRTPHQRRDVGVR